MSKTKISFYYSLALLFFLFAFFNFLGHVGVVNFLLFVNFRYLFGFGYSLFLILIAFVFYLSEEKETAFGLYYGALFAFLLNVILLAGIIYELNYMEF